MASRAMMRSVHFATEDGGDYVADAVGDVGEADQGGGEVVGRDGEGGLGGRR